MRSVGSIYLDLEKLYDELVDDHDMQMGDLIYWLYGHLRIHRPDCIEEYVADDSHPELRYGPRPDRNSLKRKIFKQAQTWENCKIEPRIAEEIMALVDKEYK